jgi:hypothetical protein
MLQPVGAQESASHQLVVEPRVPPSSPHGCPLCPANLCKARPSSPAIMSLLPRWAALVVMTVHPDSRFVFMLDRARARSAYLHCLASAGAGGAGAAAGHSVCHGGVLRRRRQRPVPRAGARPRGAPPPYSMPCCATPGCRWTHLSLSGALVRTPLPADVGGKCCRTMSWHVRALRWRNWWSAAQTAGPDPASRRRHGLMQAFPLYALHLNFLSNAEASASVLNHCTELVVTHIL